MFCLYDVMYRPYKQLLEVAIQSHKLSHFIDSTRPASPEFYATYVFTIPNQL